MAIPVIETSFKNEEVDVADNTSTLTRLDEMTADNWCFSFVSLDPAGQATSPFDDNTNKPTGFTLVEDFGGSTNVDVWGAVYRRQVTGSDASSATVTFDTAQVVDFCAISLQVSDVDDTTPVNVIGSAQTFLSVDDKIVTSITTTEDDCLGVAVLVFDGADGGPIFIEPGSGWTKYDEHVVNTGAVGQTLVIATKSQATAGALGDIEFTPPVTDGAAGLMFAIQGAAGATPTVTDVNTDETVVDGQQDISVTVSGFNGDVTEIDLSTVSFNIGNLSFSGSGTSYSVDLPDVSGYTVDTGGSPFTSSNHTVSLFAFDDFDGEASLEVTYSPKSGWDIVDVVSGSTAEGSIFEDRVGGAPADTSQIYYPTANNTSITAAGIISTDAGTVSGQLFNITTGQWEPWTWTTGGSASNGLSFSKFILSLEGYVGSIADRAMQYLTDLGFDTGSLTDRKMAWLGSLGYTGSLNDRLAQWKNA